MDDIGGPATLEGLADQSGIGIEIRTQTLGESLDLIGLDIDYKIDIKGGSRDAMR